MRYASDIIEFSQPELIYRRNPIQKVHNLQRHHVCTKESSAEQMANLW